jgi:hypothetical protein
MTRPVGDAILSPDEAKVGDRLPKGFVVKRHIGKAPPPSSSRWSVTARVKRRSPQAEQNGPARRAPQLAHVSASRGAGRDMERGFSSY